MLDVSYFQNSTSNTQIFQNGDTWQTWIKPRGAKTVNFFVVGGGGGGGGGRQLATGNKSGGGGGANAGNVKLTLQASILPDILYILPGTGGTGGIGGAPGTAGGDATRSFVCTTPDISTISNRICTSGGGETGTGGPAGSTVAVAGGTSAAVATKINMIFVDLGNFLATVGINGAGGGLTTGTGAAVNTFMVAAGGGGGTGTGGGNGNGGPFPGISATPINTSGTGGLIFYKPIVGLTGGRGGGGGTNGGRGGNGAPGCGGGGGGAGTVSAGNGGRGGDGFVIITTNF